MWKGLRMKIYTGLVNAKPGISYRYHRMHDGASGAGKVLSWLYLLWMNFAYYVLFCRFLGRKPDAEFYEAKKVPWKRSETEEDRRKYPHLTVEEYICRLKNYDVISFDVFDTLIFRPFSQPTDLFYLMGEKLGFMDFRNVRMWAEGDARLKCHLRNGHGEVTLNDIWKNLEEDTGLSAAEGASLEQEMEEKLCYANPFMLEVWKQLRRLDKRIIVVSDMYLPTECIVRILEKAGFEGAEKVFISNAYGKSKAKGDLFEFVRAQYFGERIIHVGDNPHSDGKMAKKAGFATCSYPQTNRNMLLYRPFDMSYLVGSAYRGIVSNYLYQGGKPLGMEYEYGFLYGGLFVTGYCRFIHEYYVKEHLDKLLFLSRDGDILKQVYDRMYPQDRTEYVYWSRKAATKLMAAEDKHDYFRRFIYHKINQQITIREILRSMELEFLVEELGDWKNIWDFEKRSEKEFVDLRPKDELTDKNGYLLRRFIEAKWDKVLASYEGQMRAARRYYEEVLRGCGAVAAVDIGWAGSGALALSHLVESVWGLNCTVAGIVAGTNTIHNAEPDASEPFLQSGKLVSYMYSQSNNRDLLKRHDPGRDYNVFWELLLSSQTPQFEGFYEGAGTEAKEVSLRFGKSEPNQEGIAEIQKGILDFADEYMRHFGAYPYMLNISGRDAYAPMLAASGQGEKYLKAIEKRFHLEIGV